MIDQWEQFEKSKWNKFAETHKLTAKQELEQCKWLLKVIEKETKELKNAIS